MAQKRMFDKKVVESDKFIDLPNTAKALYFMAGMDADDKGFFQPRKLQRMCGFADDDFKLLIAKRFFISFESGVMVITDWNKNNYLDKNRISATEYIDELRMLELVNEKYELSQCLTNVKPMFNQNSIEENSIEENSIEKENIKRKRFIKPTIEEIQAYIEERNNGINANAFYDFYESKNWYVGKNKMKDWKACMRTWEQRNTGKQVIKETLPEWFDKNITNEPLTSKEDEELKQLLENIEKSIGEM